MANFNVALRSGLNYRTTNSDLTVIATFPTEAGKGYFVEFKVVNIRTTDFGAGASYWRQAAFRTDSAGTLTQIGATRTIGTDNEDEAGGLLEVDASGTNIRVLGAAANPTNWRIDAYILEVDNILLI
jgi:hypothetical protein